MNLSVLIAGLSMGLGLIVAIGAQNVFVLQQGLRHQHVFAVCLACALSDALLIALGVTSFGKIAAALPLLEPVLRFAGAGFLIWYGAKSLHSALRSKNALAADIAPESDGMVKTLLACLAFTWLNPHVYLDTVVLLGTISTQFPGNEASFAVGATIGSFLFFFSLGYGATLLRPILVNPAAWRVLEGGIAVVMWAIAFKLIATSAMPDSWRAAQIG